MTNAISHHVLTQHTALLGKTGSGKTSTGKLMVEQIVRSDPGARVCVLDAVKSDWWGLTSSADGNQPGLPFVILGGPRGHVGLNDSAGKPIGELVANGSLPLSIIDMADFGAGGLQRFFNEFAPALMRNMRGVLYLVLEEAHEFAPKERAGFGDESMAIHWAKKLATAGRSKGIRLIVLTQRTQALHNALLGSCDTMIAHRLTAPADQDPVKKWLKANVDKATFEKVSGSLASLKTGTGWICSGEAQVTELVQFPKIATYDNSATPTSQSGDHAVSTAPVDRDRLRAIIGDAVKQAEADDPKLLRAEIARLKSAAPAAAIDLAAIEAAEQRGRALARSEASAALVEKIGALTMSFQEDVNSLVARTIEQVSKLRLETVGAVDTAATAAAGPPALMNEKPSAPVQLLRSASGASDVGPLGGVQQKILNSVAEVQALSGKPPQRTLVAMMADYKNVKSTGFAKALSTLSANGHVSYPDGSTVELTDSGKGLARPRPSALTTADIHARVTKILGGTAGGILSHLIKAFPKEMDRGLLAEKSGYQNVKSTGFAKALSGLSSLGFVSYPSSRSARAGEILFP